MTISNNIKSLPTQGIVAKIRSELTSTFPDFNFRCYRDHHSTINIIIVSAPIDLLTFEEKQRGYVQISHCNIKERYSDRPEVLEVLLKIQAICTKGQTYHETGDYGMQPSFYECIFIGEYNKPWYFLMRQTTTTYRLNIKFRLNK
jgi:hypothetical protein